MSSIITGQNISLKPKVTDYELVVGVYYGHAHWTLVCVRLFNNSSKRQTFLEAELNDMVGEKRTKLKSHCQTWWVQCHYAFEVFVNLYPAVIDTLNYILETEKRSDAITDTNWLLHSITSFPFVVTFLVVMCCLGYLKALSVTLQGLVGGVFDLCIIDYHNHQMNRVQDLVI